MTSNALEAAFPILAEALPHLSLADLPTPLDEAPALAAELGIGSLAVKRDDLTSGLYGGNKVRKLEYLLAHALATGCDSVVTFGAAGSNHAIATAMFAQRLGLGRHAVLTLQAHTPQVATKLRYLLRLGARIEAARSYNHSGEIAARIAADHARRGGRVYEIPWGGSNWRGAVGFVAAALELARQSMGAPPDFVYVAGGTMGTVTGLGAGLRAAGLGTRVVAPVVVPSGTGSPDRAAKLLVDTSRELHQRDTRFPLIDDPHGVIELRPEFLGSGYAHATPEGLEAIGLARRALGLELEATYTGKALAGLVADARAGRLAGRRVVFWNTFSSAPYPQDLADVDMTGIPVEFRSYFEDVST